MTAGGTAGFVAAAAAAAPEPRARRGRRERCAWQVPVVRLLACATMVQSLVFGAVPVGIAAVTAAVGLPGLAGVILATLTAGGVIGTFGPPAAPGKRRCEPTAEHWWAGWSGRCRPVAGRGRRRRSARRAVLALRRASRACACGVHSWAGGRSARISSICPGPWRVGLAVLGAIPCRGQDTALMAPNTWWRPGGPCCLAVVAWENGR
jgi:hypothetical protein